MERYFVIGKIVNTQGIKGEIRLIPTTDNMEQFENLKEVYIDKKGNLEPYEITSSRCHKQFVLLKLRGVDDMNTAETLKNYEVKVTEDKLKECEEDEYFVRDIYGLNVITDDGEELGTVENIMFTGANDVYVVRNAESKEILIPAIKQCILDIDIENKTMKVNLLKGLR